MDTGPVSEGGFAEAVLGSVPDLAFVLGERGEIQWWNDRVPAVTGYDDAELGRMNVRDVLLPVEGDSAVDALREGAAESVAVRLLTAAGDRRPYEITGGPVAAGERVACIARPGDPGRGDGREPDRLRAVMETVWDGVYALDCDRRWRTVDRRLCELLGYDRDRLLDTPIEEILAEGFEPADVRQFERVLAGGADVGTAELTFERGGGGEVVAELRFVRTELDDGTVGTTGVVRDVTERRERERRLRRQEREYRTLAENLPNGSAGLFEADADDIRYTLVAGGIFNEIELDADDLEGNLFSEVHTDEFNERHRPRYEDALAGESDSFEVTFDGREYRAFTLPVRDADGEVISGLAMTQDIGDQKARERELEQYETLLESIDDGAYMLDRDYTVLTANTALAEMLKMDRDELLGTTAMEILDEQVVAESDRLRDRLKGGESSVESTLFELPTTDGGFVPVENRFSAMFDDDGEFVGTVGTLRDVSTRREREAQLRRQRDELETLNRINGAIQDVIEALVSAGTREEIEDVVCDRLAASELYGSVWIGRHVGDDGAVVPQTGVGPTDDFLGTVETLGGDDWERPATRCIRTGDEQVVRLPDDADSLPPRVVDIAEAAGIVSATTIPIVHRETVYGVLVVYSPRRDAFSDRELPAFRRLGRIIGFAIHAVRTERLLLADTVNELEFTVDNPSLPFARLTAAYDCRVEMEWALPIGDDRVLQYLAVEGCGADDAVDSLSRDDQIAECRIVERHGDGCLLEVTVADSVVSHLLDAGASVSNIRSEGGVIGMTAEVPQNTPVRGIVDSLTDHFSGVELVAKRTIERPVQTARELREKVSERLTEKQATAIKAAFHGGYFDWPRRQTAEEIAATLGVTSATLHYHLRHAERELVAAFTDS